MRTLIKQILSQLNNPDTASSFMPLLVVISVFILVTAGMTFLILRMLRAPEGPEATEGSQSDDNSDLVILNTAEKLRGFFRRRFVGSSADGERAMLAELEVLRARNAKLEKENANLRAVHAKALNRVTELSEQMAALQKKSDGDTLALQELAETRDKLQTKLTSMEHDLKEATEELEDLYKENAAALQRAEERREKAQVRMEEIETQLKSFIGELEQLYKSNAPLSDVSKLGGKLDALFQQERQESVPNDLEGQVIRLKEELAKQEFFIVTQREEIKKMKALLKVAREQIVAITAKMKAPTSGTPAASTEKAA